MPEVKAKTRANVAPDPRASARVNNRANEDVVQAMLEAMVDCKCGCKKQAIRERWSTLEIEDGVCFKCYHALMEAGLV